MHKKNIWIHKRIIMKENYREFKYTLQINYTTVIFKWNDSVCTTFPGTKYNSLQMFFKLLYSVFEIIITRLLQRVLLHTVIRFIIGLQYVRLSVYKIAGG